MFILKNGGRLDLDEAARKLRLKDAGRPALGSLRRLGLIAGEAGGETPPRRYIETPDSVPDYATQDVVSHARTNPEFAALVDEVQKITGTVLTASGLTDLFGFYDYLGLPTEVILLMVSHCTQECERKYGPGKRPAMRDIKREAYRWANREIRTLEAATEYIKKSETAKRAKNEFRRRLGIDGRALSPTEDRYLSDWAERGYATELVVLAYDKTVTNTGRLAWKYMDAILASWAEKGLRTEEAVREGDKKAESAHPAAPGGDKRRLNGEDDIEALKKYRDKLKNS